MVQTAIHIRLCVIFASFSIKKKSFSIEILVFSIEILAFFIEIMSFFIKILAFFIEILVFSIEIMSFFIESKSFSIKKMNFFSVLLLHSGVRDLGMLSVPGPLLSDHMVCFKVLREAPRNSGV